MIRRSNRSNAGLGLALSLTAGLVLAVWATPSHAQAEQAVTSPEGRNYLFVGTHKSWCDAVDYCRSKGADWDLAKVETPEENAWILSTMQGFGSLGAPWGVTFYIGANDRTAEGNWVWSADGEPVSWTSWKAGEPNNDNGDGDCLEFNLDGTWNDRGCGAGWYLSSVCEQMDQPRTAEPAPCAGEASVAPPAPQLIGHWTFEAGQETVDLTGNFGDLTLYNATVTGGKLDVNDNSTYAVSGPYTGQAKIRAKTLVSWVWMDSLDVRSGSILTIDNVNGDNFDAIVYAERQPKRWMAGSSFFRRTQDVFPVDETATGELLQLGISYEDLGGGQTKITVCRYGQTAGQYQSGNMTEWTTGNAEVIFGKRHGGHGHGPGQVDAKIEEARIYSGVLNCDEIAEIQPVAAVAPPRRITDLSQIDTTKPVFFKNRATGRLLTFFDPGGGGSLVTHESESIEWHIEGDPQGQIKLCRLPGSLCWASYSHSDPAQSAAILHGGNMWTLEPTGDGYFKAATEAGNTPSSPPKTVVGARDVPYLAHPPHYHHAPLVVPEAGNQRQEWSLWQK